MDPHFTPVEMGRVGRRGVCVGQRVGLCDMCGGSNGPIATLLEGGRFAMVGDRGRVWREGVTELLGFRVVVMVSQVEQSLVLKGRGSIELHKESRTSSYTQVDVDALISFIVRQKSRLYSLKFH